MNFIHLEKRTTWTGWGPPWGEFHSLWRRGLPWSESHSLWRGGAPWGESHSLGEGDPLDRGDLHEANPIRFGEGDSHEANPFAEERRKPLRWIHSLVHSLWRGGTPWRRLPPVKEKGTPLNGVAYSRKIGARNEWSLIALLETRLQEQDRWRRRLDDDDLEGKDQARVPGKVLGGEIIRYGLKATPTC